MQLIDNTGLSYLIGKIKTMIGLKADKTYVDNKVKTDVPLNAKFTDTIVDISGKQDKLTAGDNITITNNTISATDTKYTHPTHTTKANGLYKVTVDNQGHVSATSAVAKADITALGIPAQDTVYNDNNNLFASGGPVEDVPPQTTVVDADTLGGRPAEDYVKSSQVLTNVPSGAIFTDTIVDISGKADKTYVDNKVKTDVPLGAIFTDTIVDISGKADKTYVDNKVKTDVPLGAIFTDTIATKSSLGLALVDNVKQMPITGGTFTGIAKAQNNTNQGAQIRNIILSPDDAVLSSMQDGDIWIKYE